MEKREELYICGKCVGYAEIVYHSNYIYCKYVEVYKEYRKCGYGKLLIDRIMANSNLPLRFSVTSTASTGFFFWKSYTVDKEITEIKKLTFEIKNS